MIRGRTAAAVALAVCWPAIAPGQNVVEEVRLASPKRANWCGVSTNGRLAVAVGEDHQLRVWNLPEGRLLRMIDLGPTDVAFTVLSADGGMALIADYQGGVRILDTAHGTPRMQSKVWPYAVAAALSADGTTLALAPANEPVQVIDIASGRRRCELQRTVGGSAALAFSHDGARIVAGDADTAVRVYDARNGELLSRFTDFLLEPLAVNFAPDGKQVAAAGGDKVIAFLDAANGRLLRKTERQEDVVSSVTFSLDGRYVAAVLMNSASQSKPAPVTVWETSGRKVLEWNPPSVGIGSNWTDDGRLLIMTSTEDAVHIWRVR